MSINPAEGEPLVSRLFVLGGARSGKSNFAEAWIQARSGPKLYIATAEARDSEMAGRIARHKERRGAGWRTLEAPLDIVKALSSYDSGGMSVLIDCLTLWVSNLIEAERDVEAECERLVKHLAQSRARIAIVSNEVGLGIVPDNELARQFRDEAGRVNQRIAAEAKAVVFMAAGLPMLLKGPKGPLDGGRFSGRGRSGEGSDR